MDAITYGSSAIDRSPVVTLDESMAKIQREPLAQYLTMREAADYVRMHKDTIRRYIREKRLAYTQVGNKYLILKSDLDKLMKPGPSVN